MAEGPRSSEYRVGVFIIAENRLLREAFTRILSNKTDIYVLGSAQYTAETIQRLSPSEVELLLMNPPALSGRNSDHLLELRPLAARFKLVLVGMEEDEQTFLWAVRAGTPGYLLKDASARDVVATVRAVARGEAVCPPRLSRFLFNYVMQQWVAMPNACASSELGLTRREQQLIPLVARGLTNKEIAAQFGLSEQTVKNQVHRILRKVDTEDRLRAVEICRARGWIA